MLSMFLLPFPVLLIERFPLPLGQFRPFRSVCNGRLGTRLRVGASLARTYALPSRRRFCGAELPGEGAGSGGIDHGGCMAGGKINCGIEWLGMAECVAGKIVVVNFRDGEAGDFGMLTVLSPHAGPCTQGFKSVVFTPFFSSPFSTQYSHDSSDKRVINQYCHGWNLLVVSPYLVWYMGFH